MAETVEKRGAVAPIDEIEITPAMIEAGIDVLSEYREWISLSPSLEEMLVRELLDRALAAAPIPSNSVPR
jgi:hypothetical protein